MKNILKVQEKMDVGAFIISLLIAEGTGFIAGAFTKNSMAMYNTLNKPPFSPPAIVFPIIWPILYALMALAAYRVYMVGKTTEENVKGALMLYGIQLILNFLWPFLFFTFRLYGLAFIEIVILLIFIVLTTIAFFKKDKISGMLMIPYILWVAYAAVLNFFIWATNEM